MPTPVADARDPAGVELLPAEFEAVRALIYGQAGITLGPTKRDMVKSRLARRLRHHELGSVGEYLRLVRDDPAERQEFVNCLTTNKTDFFREAHHFDHLRQVVVPAAATRRRLRAWCAASSTGEEPYTLAMTLREACPPAGGWDIKVLCSDIDTAVLATAQGGVYPADRAADVPPDLLRRYFLKGGGANAGKVAARPELKELLTFRQINLMADRWPVRGPFDAIFCRNVFIYFDRPTQKRLLDRFAGLLVPGGHLYLGHSENIHGLTDRFAPLGQTIYRLRAAADTPPPARAVTPPPRAASAGGGRQPPVSSEPKKREADAPRPPKQAGSPPPPVPAALPEHNLIVGDVKALDRPGVLKTLLGSCVAVCLYDPVAGVGGMNHISLPGGADAGADGRYGGYSMELLITAVMKAGGERDRFRAKVFGGAKVLAVASKVLDIGARNAAFVLQFLEDEGFPVDARKVGGDRGLVVRFEPHTGRAQVRPLAARDLSGVARDEARYGRELAVKAARPADDAVTLF